MIKRKFTRFVVGVFVLFAFCIIYTFIRDHPHLLTKWKIDRIYSEPQKVPEDYQTISNEVTENQNTVPKVIEKDYAIFDERGHKNHTHQEDVDQTNIFVSLPTFHRTSTLAKPELPAEATKTCDLDWELSRISVAQYKKTSMDTNLKKKVVTRRIYDNSFIKLDPDKFLYAVLRWGPNNQLFGFHEAVILSIVLNRTVVLPIFIKHHKDRQHPMKEISPAHRIDIESLCKFVSCITLDAFKETCNFIVDAILNTKFLQKFDILRMEGSTGMKILTKGKNLSSLLFPPDGTSKQNPERTFLMDEAKKLFNISSRCVLYPYPMLDLRTYNTKGERVKLHALVRKKVPPGKMPETDQELFASVLQRYQRPPYVRKMAAEYVTNVMNGQPFISVHWRYNKNDFLSHYHCNVKDLNKKICDRAKAFTAENLAERVIEEIKSLQTKKYNVQHIYIASPPDMFKMINEVENFLKKTQPNWKLHTSVELTNFIKLRYAKCGFLMEHYDDIVSTTEMEICSLGLEFMGSLGTSWSANVKRSRIFGNITGIRHDYDSLIFAAV